MATVRPKVYVHIPVQVVAQGQDTVRQVPAAEAPKGEAARDTYTVRPRFYGNDFIYLSERREPRPNPFQALIDWLFG